MILRGDENKVIENYRNIYDQGVEPKIFINDFLEILYYFKNINSLSIESANFLLNDEEFNRIKEISKNIDSEVLILFWQFTIKTLGELDIVSNQNLSIEMFLLRLIHIKGIHPNNENKYDNKNTTNQNDNTQTSITSQIINKETINQIKNVAQEKKIKLNPKIEKEVSSEIKIRSFNELINFCSNKKEMNLKYELETNVNLVKFENCRIEISFNDNLDKDFVKNLTIKLLEWTNQRWIISFSKKKGEISIKDKEKNKQKELIEKTKKTDFYKTVIDYFPDAELIEVKPVREDEE